MEKQASKLEELMDQRSADEKRFAEAQAQFEEARRKKSQRQHRLFIRKEFNRLFHRLRRLVEGHWDRYGWGWKFQYKGGDYWISYDSWHHEKTPGDVDDYDSSGYHWVLKSHWNASPGDSWNRNAFTLREESKDMTEEVLRGLKELQDPKGLRW